MNIRSIFRHAFSTQKSTEPHTHDDSIQIFGVLAILAALLPGSFLFLYLIIQSVPFYAKAIGFLWMMYAELLLVGVILHDRNKKKQAAHYFTWMGVVGFFIGAGFFLSALTSLATGILIFRQVKLRR